MLVPGRCQRGGGGAKQRGGGGGKTSRGWPLGNHFGDPPKTVFEGCRLRLREILGVCKGIHKRNDMGGGGNVPSEVRGVGKFSMGFFS